MDRCKAEVKKVEQSPKKQKKVTRGFETKKKRSEIGEVNKK